MNTIPLSTGQRRIMTALGQGWQLRRRRGIFPPLVLVYATEIIYSYTSVHAASVRGLVQRGLLIAQDATEMTDLYSQDYRLSDLGQALIKEITP